MKKVPILGIDGVIGHHSSKRISETPDRHVGDRGQVAAARALVD